MEPRKIRVLIAEDNEEGRYLLEALLRGVGYEVVAVGNGAEALERLQTQDFEIIITDILMPVMDGFQLCMNVKQDNRLRDIPFLFYSAAYVDELDEDLAMMMGAARFVRKPEDPEEFTKIIDEMMTEFREGRIRPTKPHLECRGILLQRYNDRIVNKLQEKTLDLEREIAERMKAEEATDRANQEWERTFNAISDLVMVLDDQHKIVRANKAMADALRMPEHRLRGRLCFELVHGKKEPPAFCPLSQLLIDGEDHSTEAVEPRLGGIYDVRVSPLVGQHGRITGSVHIIRDITDSKRAEEALRESEEQYRAVFHNAGIGIKVVSRNRRIIRANPALLKMLGYSEVEILELTPVDITHPDDLEITKQYLDAILGYGLDSLGLEKRYIRKDGSVIWGSVSISAMRDAQGNKIGALEVIADITDKTKSQIALQESEKRMRRIIDSSPVGIRITRDGGHVYANRALARMFGYESPEEILAIPAEALFAPESRALIRQRVVDRMAGKPIPPHYEASGMTKHGKIIALESWGTEIDYLGKKSWLAFTIDVSEAKSLRAQLLQAQKMEAIATLAGGIAHDFNNLLQVVLGYSDMMLFGKKSKDPDYKRLEAIRRAGLDGSQLAKGLLAFSRRVEPNTRPVNLNHEIARVTNLLERTVPKMVRIETLAADNLNTTNLDPVQIQQVLMNLAVNAVHAMPDGGRLTIETANVTVDEDYCRIPLEVQPGEYVLLTVSDTGHGMDQEVVEHIFEPFYTTKGPGEGTGLGLAIVYGIVKQHSGHVTCYSEPGIGTTFKIYLPAVVQEAEADVSMTHQMPAFGTETILLVDDEARIREMGKEMLQLAGYTVLEAENGEEAVNIYRKRMADISLVILDLIMPVMGGKQCLEQLLKINPEVKVVVASGYSVNGTTKTAIEKGSRGFVSKPYRTKEILMVVRKVLDEVEIPAKRADGLEPVSVGSGESEGPTSAVALSPAEASSAQKAPLFTEFPRRFRILAIDDRVSFLTMLNAGFSQFGQTVFTATSGVEGLRVFLETPVDLVICDLGMPELNGWEVGKRIKEICLGKGIQKIPIILLTGSSDGEEIDREERDKMAECGVDAIVGKPVDIPELLKVAGRLINRTEDGVE